MNTLPPQLWVIYGEQNFFLKACVSVRVCEQTALRSLHLPKNNSLYVLTPDIAPTASTSKNRYSHYLSLCITPYLQSHSRSSSSLYPDVHGRWRTWVQCLIADTRWRSASTCKVEAFRVQPANATLIDLLSYIWPAGAHSFSYLHCDILKAESAASIFVMSIIISFPLFVFLSTTLLPA